MPAVSRKPGPIGVFTRRFNFSDLDRQASRGGPKRSVSLLCLIKSAWLIIQSTDAETRAPRFQFKARDNRKSVHLAVLDRGSPSLSNDKPNHLYSRIAKAIDLVRLARQSGILAREESSEKAGVGSSHDCQNETPKDTERLVQESLEDTVRAVCQRQLGEFSLKNLGKETGIEEPENWLKMNDRFTSIQHADPSPSTTGETSRMPYEIVIPKTYRSSIELSPDEQFEEDTAALKEKIEYASRCLHRRSKGQGLDCKPWQMDEVEAVVSICETLRDLYPSLIPSREWDKLKTLRGTVEAWSSQSG
jgi:hypothetical protein